MNDNSSLILHATLSDLERIRCFVESKLQTFQISPSDLHDIMLITMEAATNILLHGYQGNSGQIEIGVKGSRGSVIVVLRDQAPYFDPMQVLTPDLTLPLEKRSLGGMGVHLMRQFSDQIIYRALPQGGNEISLIKHGVIPDTFWEEIDGKDN
jgi:serine/threonine-protein kinase RsbW